MCKVPKIPAQASLYRFLKNISGNYKELQIAQFRTRVRICSLICFIVSMKTNMASNPAKVYFLTLFYIIITTTVQYISKMFRWIPDIYNK